MGLQGGSLYQIYIEIQTVIKDYGKIDNIPMISVAVARDNNFWVVYSQDDHVRKISITSQRVVKEFGKIYDNLIQAIALPPGDKSLFVFDGECNLKLIELDYGKRIKDFGRVHPGDVDHFQRTLVTRDGEYLFTSDNGGGLKQCSVRDKALVQRWMELSLGLMSVSDL